MHASVTKWTADPRPDHVSVVTLKLRYCVRQRMGLPPRLMLRTLILLGLFNCVTNKICDEGSYSVINDPRRSVQAVHTSGIDIPICDDTISEVTWFRFSSYSGDAVVEREANDPVPMMRCGTEAPIYIRGNGSHPVTDDATTNATVCANYGGNTCNWMGTIQIYRCPVQGDPSYFYLYKLKSPPGCSIAYCAGEKIVCNKGDFWNGFECVNYIPAMKGSPIFSGPNTSGSGLSTAIYFSCQVQYDRQPNDTNARFRVTFLFDGQPLENIAVNAGTPPDRLEPTILFPNSSLVVVLGETHLRGRLGKQISCQADSYWDGYGDATIMKSVASYYVAFESTAESYNVDLTNGSTINVTFESTVPFTCSHCANATEMCCSYMFRMSNYTGSSADCHLFWKRNETSVMTVYFVPGTTQTKNSFALVFEPYTDDTVRWDGKSLYHGYEIPTVKMTILPQSTPYKTCHSVTDPHLLSFDGVYFNNYWVGDFYLAKAINAGQHMEVQVRHEVCNGGSVTCNCGVIVREGNSAFKISVCEAGPWSHAQRSPTVARLLGQYPEDASEVYIDGTGLFFSIRMPSGLRVEVDARAPWFSIYVYLPSEYHGKTDSASMCGNSNGNPADDYTNSDRFRIPDSSSYFVHRLSCSSVYNVAATRCGCNTTYPICSNTDPTLEDVSAANLPFYGAWTSGDTCSQTPVTSTIAASLYNSNADSDFILEDDILFPPYTYDPNFGVNVSFTWPTPKLKYEQEVKQNCSDMLQSSPAYTDCSANVDLETLISMCVSDIQIADEWLSVSPYAYFFEESCLNSIAASITNSSDSTHGVLKSVSGKLCPNQCSGHGTCSGGSCSCTAGYIGADCSIDQNQAPSLTGIIRGGACDVRTRPCDVISVYGSGVALSSSLKCRFTDQTTGVHAETKGTFITAVEYSCPVPETTTHRRRRSATERTTAMSTRKVSIVADASLDSNALDFVLFDSVCMECTSSDTCTQKDNSCLITDECFANMSSNPSDSCLQCVPSMNTNSWTNVAVVGDWSSCTRDCDTGVAIRNTVCGTTVANEDVEFCKELDCPENAEQKTQGVGITLSSDDLKLIFKDPAGTLVPFTDALNQYCAKNAKACCSSIGMETHASAVAYTSSDLLTYASGYPVISTHNASLKVIVTIDRAKLAAECSQTPAQGSNIVYGASNLLYDAVTSEKSEIEETLSITITSVWSSTALPSATPQTSTSVSTIYSLISLWVLVLVWNNVA